jgi:hypothetical protein
MQEQLISFKTAVLAKEKGFDLKVDSIYSEYSNNSTIIDNSHLKEYNKFSKTEYIENKNWNKSNKFTSAPTQSLLQKWLREVYNIHVSSVEGFQDGKIYYEAWVNIFKNKKFEEQHFDLEMYSDKYEEALEIGLQEALKLIEIVKKNEKNIN